MKKFSILVATLALAGVSAAVQAESVTMSFLNDDGSVGKSAGTVTLEQTQEGLKFTPQLTGLPPGEHGFHVHEKGSCESTTVDGKVMPGGAAGGHLDPHNTKAHKGPLATDGHLGDLPFITVAADGAAKTAVVAPRLKLADVKQRALMIHVGADNYSDTPKPLGGGGGRMICGVIK
ncbi:MAG: superoxide dismutase [Cu-Zn] SodC [Achromobacter sp.]|uniref:superoxide dismutase [Cu-Zn] SodC n=1 Tax=Achromobacter sp. TaxID=134375 RepID=UPI003D03FC08